jgi:hypothetical protein
MNHPRGEFDYPRPAVLTPASTSGLSQGDR